MSSNRLPRLFGVTIVVIGLMAIGGSVALFFFKSAVLIGQISLVCGFIGAFLYIGVFQEYNKGHPAGLYSLVGWFSMIAIVTFLIGYIDIPALLFFTVVYAIIGYFAYFYWLEPMLEQKAAGRGIRKLHGLIFSTQRGHKYTHGDPESITGKLSELGLSWTILIYYGLMRLFSWFPYLIRECLLLRWIGMLTLVLEG